MAFFEARNLSKSYASRMIIEDIELHVEQGEIVGLLGVSGVGKSTLFNLLSGLEQPDQGAVIFEDRDVTGVPGQISYMQQKDLLLPFKTIKENVCLPLLLKGTSSKEAKREAEALLPVFGLEDSANQYPAQLSGGMRQRAALLRSFFFAQKMMLLDEPFSALDAITKRSMHAWFAKMRQELNLTVLLISHDIDEVLLLADRLYIMNGKPGHITAEFATTWQGERDLETTLSPEFSNLKRMVLIQLQE